MSVFNHPEFERHESVHFFEDSDSGLRAIVSIHSTTLGPAAGGCRRWSYANDTDALTDALRLSRGMSYKNAIAGLPFGGGKAVILGDQAPSGSPALFTAFGQAINSLDGRYITAEDVGVSVDDMRHVRRETPFVSGLPQTGSNAGGDPSPWTALGVFMGIQAAVKTRLSADSLNGLKIGVQGVGNVGYHLCRLLHAVGADLFVADVSKANLKRVRDEVPATEVPADELLFTDVDVLAPCALGGVLNSDTIPRIRAKVIAGAANNQLASADDGSLLTSHDILYAPDYVINAGGIISVAREYLGVSSENEVMTEVNRIPERLQSIFKQSRLTNRPTNQIADEWARHILSGVQEFRPVAVNA